MIKPVNVEALSKWVGKIPADVLRDMPVIAPMLSRLGYDPHANPPNYGRPDPKVLDNTRRVSWEKMDRDTRHPKTQYPLKQKADLRTVFLFNYITCPINVL